ncbi:MAG: hypothetical protein ACOYEQ_02795 [Bacillota bacterium]
MKREVPLAITLVVGAIIVLDYFFKIGTRVLSVETFSTEIQNWTLIVAAFAMGLAALNLIRVHVDNISQRKSGWYNSVALIVTLIIMTIIGIGRGTDDPLYRYWYTSFLAPVDATIFSLLAFYITSAAYRAFRARNLDAAVLLITAFVVMLGRAPIGEQLWKGIPNVTNWFMDFPNMAGQRGIIIGSAVGALSLGLRILVGMERSYLGHD